MTALKQISCRAKRIIFCFCFHICFFVWFFFVHFKWLMFALEMVYVACAHICVGVCAFAAAANWLQFCWRLLGQFTGALLARCSHPLMQHDSSCAFIVVIYLLLFYFPFAACLLTSHDPVSQFIGLFNVVHHTVFVSLISFLSILLLFFVVKCIQLSLLIFPCKLFALVSNKN